MTDTALRVRIRPIIMAVKMRALQVLGILLLLLALSDSDGRTCDRSTGGSSMPSIPSTAAMDISFSRASLSILSTASLTVGLPPSPLCLWVTPRSKTLTTSSASTIFLPSKAARAREAFRMAMSDLRPSTPRSEQASAIPLITAPEAFTIPRATLAASIFFLRSSCFS